MLENLHFQLETGTLKGLNEEKFRTQKLPIVLQGARGSGKTTILKYFSYMVQKERAKQAANQSLLSQIKSEGSIGFYFRCDDSFVNTFKAIFGENYPDNWLPFFEHYLELSFCKQILTILIDLNENEEIVFSKYENTFISNILSEINLPENVSSIERLLNFVNNELKYIDLFKNRSFFSSELFSPSIMFKLYTLSEILIKNINGILVELEKVIFLILVDEFENLTLELQQFFNTAIKFIKPNISLRISRRSEGIITTATINNIEYLRVKHDYFLYEINKGQDFKDVRNYFKEIAAKRLLSSNSIHGDIINLLGDKESLVEECVDLCKGKTTHLNLILSEKPSLNSNVNFQNEIISIIKNPVNPIAETINALWVIRSTNDPLIAAENAKEAMNAFFNKEKHIDAKKYSNDYNNKYRYSITALLASIYKKKKLYYGFNTIAHLADGNPRTFINICRAIINDALFYEKPYFLKTNTISKQSQNRAISEFSISEFNDVCSIIKYGNSIRNLILNAGNVFSEYHKDKKIRYPETNQFVFNKLELLEEERNIIDVAENWSMIIKRERTQRVSVSIDRKGDIYYINRAFSPIFGISYRIRGGVNVQFSRDEISRMMVSLTTESKLFKQNKNITPQNDYQLSIFDWGNEIE